MVLLDGYEQQVVRFAVDGLGGAAGLPDINVVLPLIGAVV